MRFLSGVGPMDSNARNQAVVLGHRYAELTSKKEPRRHMHVHFSTAEQQRLVEIAEGVGIFGIFDRHVQSEDTEE